MVVDMQSPSQVGKMPVVETNGYQSTPEMAKAPSTEELRLYEYLVPWQLQPRWMQMAWKWLVDFHLEDGVTELLL